MKALFIVGIFLTSSAFAAPSCFQTALRQKGNLLSASAMVVKLSSDLKDSKINAQISLIEKGQTRSTDKITCTKNANSTICDSGDGRISFTLKEKTRNSDGSLKIVSLQAEEIFVSEQWTDSEGLDLIDDVSVFGRKIQINNMNSTTCS